MNFLAYPISASVELKDGFTPYILGTISLIAFLSVRNHNLAVKVREICKEIKDAANDKDTPHMLEQLCHFLCRYKTSNGALVCSMIAVFLFGATIATCLIDNDVFHFSDKTFWADLSMVGCIAGGVFATIATSLCVSETIRARRSLFTNVVYAVINSTFKLDTQTRASLEEIKKETKGEWFLTYVRHELIQELDRFINLKNGSLTVENLTYDNLLTNYNLPAGLIIL